MKTTINDEIQISAEDAAQLSLAELEARKKAAAERRRQLDEELKRIEENEASERRRLETLKYKGPKKLTQKELSELQRLTDKARELQQSIDKNFDEIAAQAEELRSVISKGIYLTKGTNSNFPFDSGLVQRLLNAVLPARCRKAWNRILGF